jgi:guanine nucleotide-binding protein G(i) subunit alpha
MGVCVSQMKDSAEKERSDAIDRQIAEDERSFKKECKILLLGSGESGKSTIVKCVMFFPTPPPPPSSSFIGSDRQMKIIHQSGFSHDELLVYRSVVNRNLVESAQALVLAMRKLGVDCVHGANRVSGTVYCILAYKTDIMPLGLLPADSRFSPPP